MFEDKNLFSSVSNIVEVYNWKVIPKTIFYFKYSNLLCSYLRLSSSAKAGITGCKIFVILTLLGCANGACLYAEFVNYELYVPSFHLLDHCGPIFLNGTSIIYAA